MSTHWKTGRTPIPLMKANPTAADESLLGCPKTVFSSPRMSWPLIPGSWA